MSKIKEVRKELGLTQIQIYETLGIPTRTQQDWEGEKRTPSEWLEAMVIREYYRISISKKLKKVGGI